MAIVLAVLGWVGIVLGGVLGLAVLLVILVTCVPIRYYLSGSNGTEAHYCFRISWLFRLVSVIKREDSDEIWFRLLGIPLFCLAGRGAREEKKEPSRTKNKLHSWENGKAEKSGRGTEKEKGTGKEAGTEKEKGTGKGKEAGTGMGKGTETGKEKKFFSFEILSGIMKFMGDVENKRVFRKIQRELRMLIRVLAPCKIRGSLVLGTGDPAATGLVIGGISLLPLAYREGIRIMPDFDEKVFQVEGMLSGWVRPLYFVRLGIRLYRDRELVKMWNKIQRLKKEAA